MKIYASEIKDGLAELVKSSSSVAYCSQATLCQEEVHNKFEVTTANTANPKQIDLYYIKSILVSTGWNKNDDVFTSQATWDARSTPEDKQFNLMHNENDIIGHITGCYVLDKNGNQVDDDTQPDDFDIITEAVLYNSWTQPENRQRMEQIIAEIEEGKWFVSMECLFSGFDYALLDSNGKAQILERNEDSSFLTKHLRAYGGNGEYEGYKVGRSLRGISFSGKGLVSKPANPRSVILDASRAFCLNSKSEILTSFPQGENDMSDTNLLEKQLADLQSELASIKEENQSLHAKISEVESKETLDSIAKLEANLSEKEEEIKALEASIAEKEAAYQELFTALEAKEHDMKEKMEELRKMKKAETMRKRMASLLDLGLDNEEAEESAASYEGFDDATFEAIIVAMKKMDDKKKKMMEEEAMKMKPRAEESVTDSSAEEAEAEAEVAAEEALEKVETTEAALVDASGTNDELEATRASVAKWLENNVLSK